MKFDAATWWLAVLILGFVTGTVAFLLKRSVFGRIDSLQEDVKQIRSDYTPKKDHREDMDECRKDIKQIKENYITKDDYLRGQEKTERKLDRIMDILLDMSKKGGEIK